MNKDVTLALNAYRELLCSTKPGGQPTARTTTTKIVNSGSVPSVTHSPYKTTTIDHENKTGGYSWRSILFRGGPWPEYTNAHNNGKHGPIYQ